MHGGFLWKQFVGFIFFAKESLDTVGAGTAFLDLGEAGREVLGRRNHQHKQHHIRDEEL